MKILLLLALVLLVFGLAAGGTLGYRAYSSQVRLAADRIYERRARPAIATLEDITRQATTGGDALAATVSCYDQQGAYLAALWHEAADQRLRAFSALFIVHISHPYGEVAPGDAHSTLLGYSRSPPRSHCG